VDCGSGTFNDKEHNKEARCEPCENNCENLSREYSQQCTTKQNSECGVCLEGYYAETAPMNGTLAPCFKCVEGSDIQMCITFFTKKKVSQLTKIVAVALVGGIVVIVIVVIAAVCTVRKVKARRKESRRRLSTRNDTEMNTLMDNNKDANTSLDLTDSKNDKPGKKAVTSGVQTGESLRYAGNGGDEKKGVTFGPDLNRKGKGILKVDISRRPGDGQPAPPVSVDPTPTTDSKSPFSNTPWWMQNSNTVGQSPDDSIVSNEVFLEGKNTPVPVPPTPEYESSYPGIKPPSLASCVSRQSSNFQSLPSDPDEDQ
jgi:hypothetical protein